MPDENTPDENTPAETALTRRQRLVRLLFRVVGPAQVGLPPYASQADRERYEADRTRSETSASAAAPPGYRLVTYVDEHGITHRSAVPTDPAAPVDPPADPT